MITVGFSTRSIDKNFIKHLEETSGLTNIEIIPIENNGDISLSNVYNSIIESSKYDYIVLLHDDITLEKKWGKKILTHLQKGTHDIIGVAGGTELDNSCKWWNNKNALAGQVYHHVDGKKWLSKFSGSFNNEIVDVCCIDGLFIGFDKTKVLPFSNDITGFHFYDIDFSIKNHINGSKIGVITNISIIHKSVGMINDEWGKNREVFYNKYSILIPFKIKPNILCNNKEINIKNEKKVAIIIPTKDKIELLLPCLKSFNKTNYKNYKIFIADTGSTDDNKKIIKENIINNDKITLIEYDYYNFAKINNDVVNNHIDSDTDLILFSNNDIELINDSLSFMVKLHNENKNTVGTVGARLHYSTNQIQHNGISIVSNGDDFHLTHLNLKSCYGYDFNINKEVVGNTGGFLLISKELFKLCGQFNETYIECFEDVELNLMCLLKNKKNLMCDDAVCYHHESQSRGKNLESNIRMRDDYELRIKPFLVKNNEYFNIKNKITFVQRKQSQPA